MKFHQIILVVSVTFVTFENLQKTGRFLVLFWKLFQTFRKQKDINIFENNIENDIL